MDRLFVLMNGVFVQNVPCFQGNFSNWPVTDFNALPLSKEARNQLSNIDRLVTSKKRIPGKRLKLLSILLHHAFDPERGLYVPMSPRVKLKGYLPDYSRRFTESWHRKFEQFDKWLFCLTAARILAANQERR
jgi:hypothetical protein